MNDDIDPRILWPIAVFASALPNGDPDDCFDWRDARIVFELGWDPGDPYAVTVRQYELGYEDCVSGPLAVFDIGLIERVLATGETVGELGIRLESHRLNAHQPPDPATTMIAVRVNPDQPSEDALHTPWTHLAAFLDAVRARRCEPAPLDWDSGLLALLGGAA